MRPSIITATMAITFALTAALVAAPESLFPDVDESAARAPSLSSALNEFDNVLGNASQGELDSLNANGEYNQERIAQLQQQLAEKQAYLDSLPDIVARQFDELMRQYADADQQQKDRIADDLQARWQTIENRVRTDIAELTEQLELATSRSSESAIKARMLRIDRSMVDSESAFAMDRAEEDDEAAKGPSDAYRTLLSMSGRRILSRIRSFCPIAVKPLDTDISVSFLDK